MNPKGLESTDYTVNTAEGYGEEISPSPSIILSQEIQERSNSISPPVKAGRFRQNRMVRLRKMGQEANA